MDIASAQWTLNKLGRVNRIDLQLAPGTDVEAFRARIAPRLPPGVLAVAPAGRTRPRGVGDACLSGQSQHAGIGGIVDRRLSGVLNPVPRRDAGRRGIALLRALGVTQGQVQLALLAEGA